MVIDMDDEQLGALEDLQGFRGGSVIMNFTVAEDERQGLLARTFKRFRYGRWNRANKAVVLGFVERISGYSRQQISRLLKRGGERWSRAAAASAPASAAPTRAPTYCCWRTLTTAWHALQSGDQETHRADL